MVSTRQPYILNDVSWRSLRLTMLWLNSIYPMRLITYTVETCFKRSSTEYQRCWCYCQPRPFRPSVAPGQPTYSEETRTSPLQRACLLEARATHSDDWLLALPVTACGLRLDDEAVRIVVAFRLSSELGSPHSCCCGSLVDATGTHGLVCKHVSSRVVRHHVLNLRALAVPSVQRAFR